ncbi:MAG: TRAP transporter substrate-binding protein [Deltaproteobacteria bacterium]|uniref:TRAP transporter substrate-binding protein n=1 Tax=Desulfobacula sp. TaxID=2593537 RepID=UPI0019B8ED61|nr:TRAP transporter substrate-binding protein [Candidatus Desulfobacula maris]MBL6993531.1 TRAP transporter substrate-binding protein [Desulfobacula sp.]
MKKCKVALTISSIFFLMTILSSSVMAKQLNFSSWLPPGHPIVADMMLPWMENVKKATGGRVDITLLAKGLGHPKSYFDIVKNGMADAGYTCNAYSPGRFTLSEGVELPFLGNSAEANSVAYWRTYKKYFEKGDEYKGVQLLGVMTHGPGQIHNSKKVAQSIADLKGMKFRVPGGIAAQVAASLGIVGIQKPASQAYELLSRGVADGVVLPLESIKSFKITKVVPYTTLVPDGLYNVSFYLVMNQDTFNSFSPADQKAVMAVSGEAFAKLAGRAWDAADRVGLADMKANGNSVETASKAFIAEIKEATKHLEEDWVKKANEKGVDGAAALKFFRGQVANYDVIN